MSEKSGGRGSNGVGPADVYALELPSTLRQIRDHRRLSRATAYKRSGVSPSYISQLEHGLSQPSQKKLNSLIAGYKLNDDQARYLRELRSRSVDIRPDEELRKRVASQAGFSAHLDDLQKRGMPGAYLNPLFTVLMCNDLLRSVFPAIDEAGSILVWMFTPVAKEVHANWEVEAARAIAAAKPVLARHRESDQAQALLRRLRRNSDFRRIWASNIDISYGRDSTDLEYFRIPGSDELVAYSLTMSAVPETSDLMLLNVVAKQGKCLPEWQAT
ncbi:helix-turn-helix domain-containing protein [Nocardia sp. NPDC057030]|uniref:MmyB family transcriptional regulator n=1 Tax=unclassified Nocardia TaxID=2637762 RepID=UPI003628E355